MYPENINYFFVLFRLIAFQKTKNFQNPSSINIFMIQKSSGKIRHFRKSVPISLPYYTTGAEFGPILLPYTTIVKTNCYIIYIYIYIIYTSKKSIIFEITKIYIYTSSKFSAPSAPL